jgi:hypothetical protein
LLPAYTQYPHEVSLDEIEQAFLSDRKMYLSGMLSDIFFLQIYHSEEEDAENDECVLLLMIGDDDNLPDEGEERVILNSEAYPLEQIIHYLRLDRTKAMWTVDKDEPRFLSDEELKIMGHTEEEIRQIHKNREE